MSGHLSDYIIRHLDDIVKTPISDLTSERLFYIIPAGRCSMSGKGRSRQLQQTISILQQRWGPAAIRTAQGSDAALPPALRTGFRAVDGLLGIGGLPRGRMTELIGCGTAGQATLAAKALVEAQRAGLQVAWTDVHHDVDLDFLARCGVGFDSLTILRPWDFTHALAMTGDLLREGGVGTLVFDRVPDLLPDEGNALDVALRDWNPILNRSLCALLILTETTSDDAYPEGLPLPFFASARLRFQRQEWLWRRRHVTGFTSQVTVLKNKFGPSGQSALIRVHYANGIQAADA